MIEDGHSAQASEIVLSLKALAEKIAALPADSQELLEQDLLRLRASLQGILEEHSQPVEQTDQPAAGKPLPDAPKFEAILENMIEGVQVLDHQGRITCINANAKQMFQQQGIDASTLVGKRLLGEVLPDSIDSDATRAVRRVLTERIPLEVNYYSKIWKGWWQIRIVPHEDGGILVFSKDISEHMQLIEELHESEKNLNELIKYAPAGIYEIDFHTRRFTTVNDAMCELSGYSREELLNIDAFEILDTASRQVFQARINQWLSGQKPEENVAYRVIRKDGREIDVMLNVTFKSDENGRPVGATVVGFDVTSSKEAERQAEESRLILEAVIQQMPAGVILTDAAGQPIKTNAEMNRIWRYNTGSGEENLENRHFDLSKNGHEYQLEGWPLSKALQSGNTALFEEMTIRRGDGTEGMVEAGAAPIRDLEGRIIAGVMVIIDITERKQAEERQRQSEARLHQSQAIMSQLVKTSFEGIWSVDRSGKTTFLNQRAAEILGYSVEEIYDRSAFEFLMAGHEDRGRATLARIMEGKSGRVEAHARHKDGSELSLLVSYSPMLGENGEVEGAMAMFSDITERQQAEEALRESEARERARAAELEALMDAVPAIIWISRDPLCQVMIGNQYGYQFLRMGPQENLSKTAPVDALARQPYRNLKDGRPLPADELPMQIAAKTGKPAHDYGFDLLFDDGELRHLLGNVNPLFDAEGKPSGAVGAFMDVTALRRLQKQQVEAIAEREVHHRLMEQRERERQNYARDIHDGPIQILSSVGFNLHYIKEAYPDPALRVELDQIGLSVKSAVQELRQLINELRPPSVIRFGLSRAIRIHAEDIRDRYPQIKWDYRLAEDGNLLPEPVCLALFRIYREAVNNIVRHSQSKKAYISYQVKADEVILQIKDYGKGFVGQQNVEALTRENHFGLAGILERAEAIGGSVKISSRQGKGTTILVKVAIVRP